MKRKLLSVLLCLAMALTLVPSAALAEDVPVDAHIDGEIQAASATDGEEQTGETQDVSATDGVAKIGDTFYATLAEAVSQATSGAAITLEKDVTLTEGIKINKALTLDLNGKKIQVADNATIWKTTDGSVMYAMLSLIGAEANLTVNDSQGGGGIIAKKDDSYAIDLWEGATLTINGKDNTDFIGNLHTVYVHTGTANINGGKFDLKQLDDVEGKNPFRFELNCLDANATNTAKIIVKGGIFVGVNPSNTDGDLQNPTNYVASGYEATAMTDAVTSASGQTNVTAYKVAETAPAKATVTDAVAFVVSDAKGYEKLPESYKTSYPLADHPEALETFPWLVVTYSRNNAKEVAYSITKDGTAVTFTEGAKSPNTVNADAYQMWQIKDHLGQTDNVYGKYVVTLTAADETPVTAEVNHVAEQGTATVEPETKVENNKATAKVETIDLTTATDEEGKPVVPTAVEITATTQGSTPTSAEVTLAESVVTTLASGENQVATVKITTDVGAVELPKAAVKAVSQAVDGADEGNKKAVVVIEPKDDAVELPSGSSATVKAVDVSVKVGDAPVTLANVGEIKLTLEKDSTLSSNASATDPVVVVYVDNTDPTNVKYELVPSEEDENGNLVVTTTHLSIYAQMLKSTARSLDVVVEPETLTVSIADAGGGMKKITVTGAEENHYIVFQLVNSDGRVDGSYVKVTTGATPVYTTKQNGMLYIWEVDSEPTFATNGGVNGTVLAHNGQNGQPAVVG